ncbi:MAG: hypothetical protein ACI85K_001444 [Hyphomicrobiaceae bacterium]|jgi:hypothetical protein
MRTLLATLLVSLVAQAQVPVLLHLTICGPAAWRSRIGPTNLGTMLASKNAEAIWGGYVAEIGRTLRSASGVGEKSAAERLSVFDYGGDIHIVAWLDQAEDAAHLRRWSAALIVEPDGYSDLKAMAVECQGWIKRACASASTRWLSLELSPPRLHGGRLITVLASAQDMDAATERAQQYVCRSLDGTKVLLADFDLQVALGLLRDRASQRDFVAALLGPASKRASLAISSVGPQVAIEFGAAFSKRDGGAVRPLVPASRGIIDLDPLVPAATATHYSWEVDFVGLWHGLTSAFAAAAERDPKRYRQRLSVANGCDLGAALWPHVRREVVLLWRSAEGDDGMDTTPFANACLVALVRDERALIEAVTKVLKQRGERYQIDDDGVLWSDGSVFTLRIGFGVACVALRDHGSEQCEAVLGRAAKRRRVPFAPATPPPGAPPGWNGRGRLDVTTLFTRDLYSELRWLLLVFGGMQHLPHLIDLQAEGQRWLPLLQRHGLDQATTVGGSTAEHWRLRILW